MPPPDAASEIEPAAPAEDIKAVPVRHVGRWIAAAIVAVVAVSLFRSVVTNPNFEWDVVGDFLFDDRILRGIVTTLELTVLAMLVGIVLGVLLALMRLSPNFLLSGGSWRLSLPGIATRSSSPVPRRTTASPRGSPT